MIPSRSLGRGTAVGVMLIVLSLFGCARLDLVGRDAPGLDDDSATMTMDADPNAGPVYGVEFVDRSGRTERRRIPLPQEKPIFVQQALEEAGAFTRYSQMEVILTRQPGPGQPPLRMKIPVKEGLVEVLNDYALHPGDRLTVSGSGGNGIFFR